ncbi:MAG: alpha-amylase family glycosyl hydrolase [Puniceicoccaceae bacterium]
MEESHKSEPIFLASWENASAGMIHLSEDWVSRVEKPPLFLGPEQRPFDQLEQLPPPVYGKMSGYCRLNGGLYFILFLDDPHLAFLNQEEVLVAGSFNNWDPFSNARQWRLLPSRTNGIDSLTLKIPPKVYEDCALHTFKFVTRAGHWLPISDASPNSIASGYGIQNLELNPYRTGRHLFSFELPKNHLLMGNEEVIWSAPLKKYRRKLPPTVHFHDLESALPPGVTVGAKETTFRIFAPRAQKVILEWAGALQPWEPQVVELKSVGRGLWEGTVSKNLAGAYYFYRVVGHNQDRSTHFDPDFRILDPYALAAVCREGPAIVVDPARLTNSNPQYQTPPVSDLVIAEAHVRDLAAQAPIELSEVERMGFAGAAAWIRNEGSYLRAIGVNAVEFQPIQEFDNPRREDYHWGYMTVNYFSPESSYGSQPEKASQIEEFRDLVAACHQQGLAVILDVVYNHVGEPNNLLFIDKFYYLETAPRYHLMNWSGCGNDLRSSTPMARRLIIDSLLHLIDAYGVDGFRFDLADLLGKETLLEIEKKLRQHKPDVLLITEPWSFRGHIAGELKETTWSSWNDGFRRFAEEYVNGTGNQDGIKHFIGGSVGGVTAAPFQSINYTESHDDFAWIDRITENLGNQGFHPTAFDIRRTHLMASILFASLGTPMISAGQDFLRSKHGVHNTYQRGDLNALNYHRCAEYSGTHEYFRRWIHFRLSPDGSLLRAAQRQEGDLAFFATADFSSIVASFDPANRSGHPPLIFAINPHSEQVSIHLPDHQLDTYIQIADTWRLDPKGLQSGLTQAREEYITLPPHSCALWIKSPANSPLNRSTAIR